MFGEWKAILKKPSLWVTMLGVSLIPMLYNVIFLTSMWDPYGRVNHLPVAVVNQDKAVKQNQQTLSIGKDMVASMKEGKNLDYHFVTLAKAKAGLQDGDYYMVVTLPKNLSQAASTLLSPNPEKVEITYQTTKGYSFVASKMSDSAMTKMKDQVAKSLTQTYSQAIFKNMNQLKTGMGQAADASSQLAQGASSAQNGSQTLSDQLQVLATSSQALAQGATSLDNGVQTYTAGTAQLSNGLNLLDQNSASLVGGVQGFSNGLGQVQTLSTGASQLSGGLNQLASQVSLSPEQKAQLDQVIAALPALNAAIQALSQSVTTTPSSTDTGQSQETTTTTTTTGADLSAVKSSLASIDTQLQSLSGTTASTDTSAQVSAVQGTAAYQSLTPDQQAEITSAITSNAPQASSVDVSGVLATVQALENTLPSDTTTTTTTTTSPAATSGTPAASSSDGLQDLSTLASQANIILPAATSSLQGLESNLTSLSNSLSQQVVPGSQQVATGVNSMQNQLTTGANQLLTGVSSYTSAVSQLDSGAQTLASSGNQLNSGASQLSQGSGQLSQGAGLLAQGGQTLTSGLTRLSTGASQLSTALNGAKNQLSLVSLSPENAKAVSNPVKLHHRDKDKVKTNGVGMAPYMMSVALMVASLSTNVIFAKSLSSQEPKTRLAWAKNKLAVNGFIASASAVILYLAVRMIGVNPVSAMGMFVMTFVTSWTMMAIVTALVGWDQRYGAFASLILLLLQLGSSAGTYPIELSPHFFSLIRPFLPMSYSVMGLRKTISITGHIGHELDALLIFMVIGMLAAPLIHRRSNH